MFFLLFIFSVLLHLSRNCTYYFSYYNHFITNKKIFLIILLTHFFTLICTYYYTIIITNIIKYEFIYILISFFIAYQCLILKKKHILIDNQHHYLNLFASYFSDSLFSLPQFIIVLINHYDPYITNYYILFNIIGFIISLIPISLSFNQINLISIILFVIFICAIFKQLSNIYPISYTLSFLLCLFIIIVADFIYTKTRL